MRTYGKRVAEFLPTEEELGAQREHRFLVEPCISIVVPAYETNEQFLKELLASLEGQSYDNWELCIADGSRTDQVERVIKERIRQYEDAGCRYKIRYERLKENNGISENTNEGLKLVTGSYVGFMDHDDVLERNALFEVVNVINTFPDADVIYSDEDKVSHDLVRHTQPHFKPDFNLELLRDNNYICHFTVIETAFLKELKLRSGFDGAQDYDLVLRAYAAGGQFVHVPKVLYHWRCHEASTASNPQSKRYAYEAGQRALEDYCLRKGWKATVSGLKHLGFYREDYEDSVFCQRPEIGIWAKPLPGGRDIFGIRHPKGFLVSGLYENDGSMRYAGLRKGYSGPMHRAALQQSAPAADLRSMEVCSTLKERYAQTIAELIEACQGLPTAAQETKILQKSMEFCKEATAAGYGILWDPQA